MAALSNMVDLDADLAKRTHLFLINLRNELRTLDVQALDGAIMLRGNVPTFYLRQLAIACARRVAGVRNVVDEMEVHPDGQHGSATGCTPVHNFESRLQEVMPRER